MGKPLEKKYGRDDMRVATFRISHGQWEDFQRVCGDQGKSASEAITAFIDSVIDGSNIPESKGDFPDIEAMVREQIETAIAAMPKSEPDIKREVIAAIASLSPKDFEQLKKSGSGGGDSVAKPAKPKPLASGDGGDPDLEQIYEAITHGEGITAAALTKFFGLKNRSDVGHAARRNDETFNQWLRKHDPDGYSWRWEGEKGNRRYFRLEQ